ncbi:MAG: hypothetical protein SFW09_21245 [Hyphomicrobiaceae bacterium]|nr:hypothetical protein [Hyphomicrobiaceae bacterium]
MLQILRFWLLATGLSLAGMLIWAFVPVLVPLLGLTVGLGGLVACIVAAARWLERQRRPGPPIG